MGKIISIILPDDEEREVRIMAAKLDKSRSEFVREAIRVYLQNKKSELQSK